MLSYSCGINSHVSMLNLWKAKHIVQCYVWFLAVEWTFELDAACRWFPTWLFALILDFGLRMRTREGRKGCRCTKWNIYRDPLLLPGIIGKLQFLPAKNFRMVISCSQLITRHSHIKSITGRKQIFLLLTVGCFLGKTTG